MCNDPIDLPVTVDGPEISVFGVVECMVVHKQATHDGILANCPRNLLTNIRRYALIFAAF